METVNLVLGIIASILSIASVIWSAKTASKVKKITKGSASGGDKSINTVGSDNRISNGR